ncbi:hypothetical protein IAU60_006658 [Kwoniella sp. DSM 27419]
MFAKLVVASLALASSAQAALSILYPNSQTVWYKNDTVSMNWTRTDPTTDTYLFRAYLSSQDQSLYQGNHSIADSTNATADYVRVLLGQSPAGKGYIVNFVNTTNEAQVFATSDPFEIADGEITTSTTSGASSTAGSATGNIPNAQSQASTSNPFPTAVTSSAPASDAMPRFDGMTALLTELGASILLVGVGAVVAL